jgi:two-component system osmolarity sensor histidine kinase EnvZ
MKRFKKFIPRSLYGRFLLIIVLPTLVVQLVSIYVFYYAHLDVVSKHMARGVVEEMSFIKKSINKPDYRNLLSDFAENTGINFSFEGKRKLQKNKIADSNWRQNKVYEYINPLIDPYNRFKSELESHNLAPFQIFENPDDEDFIIVKVQTNSGLLSFDVPIKRITSSSAYVFTFWMILTALITSLISIIFLKNQIRGVRELSDAAEKFGRGQEAPELRPSGSKEIRSLAFSFIKMKDRVMRQITQRTDMLSAVSHDLRTPLTRMKLQLEMMPESADSSELKHDISDMEKLVDEYLSFARADDMAKHNVKIHEFLQKEIIHYYSKMQRHITAAIDLEPKLEIALNKVSLKRALINLIDNGFNYANHVSFFATASSGNLLITIDDDGPGIPESERKKVFKPFYRIDNSRNLDKKTTSTGSGLGLAIAFDAITSHGGRIKLSNSPLGGLRVTIFIPI